MMAPRILVGTDALAGQLPALLRQQGRSRILLVAGGHFLRSPAGTVLQHALEGSIHTVRETPEGLLQVNVARRDAAALPVGIDGVIAIGGGRTIDYAKALLYYSTARTDFFAAVPTTAGSGSDATSFAVIYEGLQKQSLEHPALLPGVVVWDETLLQGLSARQRAVSGLDALVQCVESLWSRKATPASCALAWEAGGWLRRHLPQFVAAPTSELGLGALYAAHYSGRAINTSRTTGAHALSYYLTAVHGIEHGHAVALLLPVFLQYNTEGEEPDGFSAVLQLLDCENGASAAARWQEYVSGLGLETTLSGLGLGADIVPDWLRHINNERFANNPVALEPERLAVLLRQTLFSS
ncbi:MAG: iron-containing alcohol dehydrogenase [Chitinophagaceae bacterium]|nr:MAG: iron-containing alcohol dehydrogenase [Chitinophagaceae bacterium]